MKIARGPAGEGFSDALEAPFAGTAGAWYHRHMKFLFRWVFRLLVLVVVLATALLLLKDILLKELFQNRFRAATGLEIHVGHLDVGLLSPTVSIEDLRIYNPPQFGGLPLLIVPEVRIDYDRRQLAEGRLHLPLLRLQVAELVIVETTNGLTNLQGLLASLQQKVKPEEKPGLAFGGIDTLNLTLGTLKHVRLTSPNEVRSWNLGIHNEVLTGLRTEQDLTLAFTRLAFKIGLNLSSPPGKLLPKALPVPPRHDF